MCFCHREDKECFICYSDDGKTDAENLYEMMFNAKSMAYPLISMADAYNCQCFNKYTHNKCIIGITKCPTCQKQVNKPNLYIKTKYDYYCPWLINWLKKDTNNLSSFNWFMLNIFMVVFSILAVCAFYEDTIKTVIPPRFKISLLFAVIITIGLYIPIFVFTAFNDYITKYWLYNKHTKHYDAL